VAAKVGLNRTGTTQIGNDGHGISSRWDDGDDTRGTADGVDGLDISGNGEDGVRIAGPETTGNLLQNANIGLRTDFTAAVPNEGNGITITQGASGNRIGSAGGVATRFNSSGNFGYGVLITDEGTVGNIIQNGAIGTDRAGLTAFGNRLGAWRLPVSRRTTRSAR
jgi:hypothetical protein